MAFPSSVSRHLENAGTELLSKGWVLSTLKSKESADVSVVYRGSSLEVISVNTNERLSAYTFGANSGGVKMENEITACIPICVGEASSHLLLAVALSSGLVCIFDTRTSKVVRAISVSDRVASLALVSGQGPVCDQDNSGASDVPLATFGGVLAVGTQEGHIMLLDLMLDDFWCSAPSPPDSDLFSSGDTLPPPGSFESDESDPADVYQVSAEENYQVSWFRIRQQSLGCGKHLCLSINDFSHTNRGQAHKKDVFQHRCTVSGETTHFPEDGVVVSSLKYVPQLGGLLAGFNFGAWQLFDLGILFEDHPNSTNKSKQLLTFSASYQGENSLPISQFVFQEPENDPRNFCYVWAIQSDNDFDTEREKQVLESKAMASLYALTYENRDSILGAPIRYSGLQSCVRRFGYTFDSDKQDAPNFPSCGSLCLSAYVLEDESGSKDPNSFIEESIDKDLRVNDSTVCGSGLALFLWQVYGKTQTQPRYYFGVFDLNAWYLVSSIDVSYNVVKKDQFLLVLGPYAIKSHGRGRPEMFILQCL